MIKLYLIFFLSLSCLLSAQSEKFTVKKDSSKLYVLYTETSAQPEFIGGQEELHNFIVTNLRFPEKIKNDSMFYSCKVYVKFEVDTSGRVLNPQIMKGCKGYDACDLEALRVVRMMPLWKPAIVDGKKVKRSFSLQITFRRA